ncbi:MAG: hypothetical protein ACT4OK_15615 [Gemmobacter sp.]
MKHILAMAVVTILMFFHSEGLAQPALGEVDLPASIDESSAVEKLVIQQISDLSGNDESGSSMTSNQRVAALRKISGDRAKIVSLSDRLERSRASLLADLTIWENRRKSLQTSLENVDPRSEADGPDDGFLTRVTADKEGLESLMALITSLKETAGTDPELPLAAVELSARESEILRRFNEFDFPFMRANADQNMSLNEIESRAAQGLERVDREVERVKLRIETEAKRLQDLKNEIEISSAILSELGGRINLTETLRADLAALLRSLDSRASTLLDTELERSTYTSNATYVFGGLVGFVIVGFFFIAYKTPDLRAVMFGAERGIQFIALFSLIIAIILFGILGILEGKELSALLGGLSGYILGRGADSVSRGATSGTTPQQVTPPPQAPQPQPQQST